MKKAVVVILTVMLTLAMCSVSLADVTTPFDDESLNVNVALKMDEGDFNSLFIGTANASAPVEDILYYGDLYEGVLYMNASSAGSAWIGFVTDKLAGIGEAEGFGCYLQNNTGNTLTFAIALLTDATGNLNNGAYTTGSNAEYALVDIYGNETTMTTAEQVHPYDNYVTHSNIEIPADFEGYLVIPFSSVWKLWGTEEDTFPADAAITGFGWLNATGDYSNGDLGIDNFFYFGADVDSVDADLITIDENAPTPTPDEEPEPTADATQPAGDTTQPADDATPSASANTSDNEGSFPWWIIAVIAVVIIVVIIIAVTASKKKKNQE